MVKKLSCLPPKHYQFRGICAICRNEVRVSEWIITKIEDEMLDPIAVYDSQKPLLSFKVKNHSGDPH